ncbi:MAG: DUF47 family protein [Firmicutes bacterium]|nr:DUF47 family protein [Bacillota bacterium]
MFAKNTANKVQDVVLAQLKDIESAILALDDFVTELVKADSNKETLRPLMTKVHEAENAADRTLRQMIESLDSSFLPATRTELVELGSICDSIANKCHHFAQMVLFQGFKFPEAFTRDILEIIRLTKAEFALLVAAIGKLYGDFGSLLKDHSILDEVRGLETQVDVIEESLFERTYALDLPLAERTQIAGHIDHLCDVSDVIENVADKVQVMLIARKA